MKKVITAVCAMSMLAFAFGASPVRADNEVREEQAIAAELEAREQKAIADKAEHEARAAEARADIAEAEARERKASESK